MTVSARCRGCRSRRHRRRCSRCKSHKHRCCKHCRDTTAADAVVAIAADIIANAVCRSATVDVIVANITEAPLPQMQSLPKAQTLSQMQSSLQRRHGRCHRKHHRDAIAADAVIARAADIVTHTVIVAAPT